MKQLSFTILSCILMWSCNSTDKSKSATTSNNPTKTEASLSPELQESMQRGAEVYNDLCITCHLPDGKGVPKSFPPLANSDYLLNNRVKSIRAIKYGLSGEIIVNGEIYNMPMAAFGLTNTEVADVMNYITNSWGNQNLSLITDKEVSEIKP
ncbi:c-type cytochrome [Psychroserpens mesophilus]|uniref:c-type cytochrome n=1 Tax=Psychroserpens mesophilus TaxID=325473 RepID=UPI001F4CA07C|nr:cytochrome c [Psychroserpens mesophilus]